MYTCTCRILTSSSSSSGMLVGGGGGGGYDSGSESFISRSIAGPALTLSGLELPGCVAEERQYEM